MLKLYRQSTNHFLFIGGILSCIAALVHLGCIAGGENWYRFFGAGEKMAILAAQGSWIPTAVTSLISSMLLVWACYAFSGADLIPSMPWIKTALLLISAVYLIRGLMLLPLWLGWLEHTEQSSEFWFWSSVICFIYGFFYVTGTYHYLRRNKS